MQRILGVDIGSFSIKVAQIERDFRSFRLVGFYEQPITYNEALGREGSITQALLKLFEEYNLSAEQVYTAIPGQMSALRVISLPFSNFKKIDQTIEFEMENYLPLPLDDLVIDYEILESTKTNSNVMINYGKKSEFVKFLTMMNGADLDPRYVGSELVEMASIVKLGVLQPEGAYAVLDIGHEKTNVTIFQGEKIQYARTILFGGRDLTKAIAESLKLPLAEAERMKIEMGQLGAEAEGADQTTRSVAEAIREALSELLLHLRQTFVAFQEAKGDVIHALILSGGTSRLPGLDQHLSSELRKNVSLLDCLDFPFNHLADSTWCRPIAATALALAYRGVIGSGIRDIQYRRGEFAYRGEVKELIGLSKQVGLLLGVVTVFALGSFIMSYATLHGKAKDQSKKMAALAARILPDAPKKTTSTPNAVLSALTSRIAEAEEKKKKIEEETTLSILDVLKEFSTTLPPRDQIQLDVDDLTIVSKRIRVQGKTTSFEAVDQIKTALGKSQLFKNVATENVRKGPKDEIKFDLSLELTSEGETKEGA